MYTYVSIRNAPFELDDQLLTEFLSKYGKADNIRKSKHSVGPFQSFLSGVRTARLIIKKNIAYHPRLISKGLMYHFCMLANRKFVSCVAKLDI